MSFSLAVTTFPSDSWKIKLPESVLGELVDSIDNPLVFKLASTHVGVLDFSAEEGTIGLSEALAQFLNTEIGAVILAKCVTLPKGSKVALKVHATNSKINWKHLLESWLPQNCTALTKGDKLNVTHLSESYNIEITDLSPSEAVCIIDTNLELDLDASEEDVAENKPFALGENVHIVPSCAYLLTVPENCLQLAIKKVSGHAYIGPRAATGKKSFLWQLPGPRVIDISPFNLQNELEIIGDGLVCIDVLKREGSPHKSETTTTVSCGNCGKDIPRQSYQIHESFCCRHMKKCMLCREVLPIESYELHWHCDQCDAYGFEPESRSKHKTAHEPSSCDCGFQGSTLECCLHRATDCPLRLVECRFCRLLQQYGTPSPSDKFEGYSEHEAICGSKTVDCHICKKHVRLRQLATHLSSHEYSRASRKGTPTLCSNQNCCNPGTRKRQFEDTWTAADLGLCQACAGPLYSGRADPDGSLLKAKIKRKYIVQLSVGCQNSWCTNKFCKSGSGETRTFEDATKLSDNLSKEVEFWFCVDQLITRKMMFVNANSDYSRGWLGEAISACKSENDALEWLKLHAPKLGETATIQDLSHAQAFSQVVACDSN